MSNVLFGLVIEVVDALLRWVASRLVELRCGRCGVWASIGCDRSLMASCVLKKQGLRNGETVIVISTGEYLRLRKGHDVRNLLRAIPYDVNLELRNATRAQPKG